ncbi:metal-binding protein [Pseudomonas cavernae]|uniref:Metal-binding protein n=1 Tax=Pseudomonas cavernae TaxID=2320867 RepID=A0A385YX98_9PSED|nr:Ada metal-binding domain-containing protein [Pseudomonas cavernae]AYC31545.1 metal-binding protein [Pseudomonas cavernae]
MSRQWTLLGADGQPFLSDRPGSLGGHRRSHIYGRLDCPVALRLIAKGHDLRRNRVFFLDEVSACAAGYRPCARCLPEAYKRWKADLGDMD